jgi:hypothetical protein
VPAAINVGDLVPGLIEDAEYLAGLLTDKRFNGKKFAESLAAQGISQSLSRRRRTSARPRHRAC